jgi:hypothetical protein
VAGSPAPSPLTGSHPAYSRSPLLVCRKKTQYHQTADQWHPSSATGAGTGEAAKAQPWSGRPELCGGRAELHSGPGSEGCEKTKTAVVWDWTEADMHYSNDRNFRRTEVRLKPT